MRTLHVALVASVVVTLGGYVRAQAPATDRPVPPNLPQWAWGVMPPAPPAAAPAQAPADDGTLLHIEGSTVGLTRTQIRGIPTIPDWHPEDHGPMPDVIAKGRGGVRACGFCHLPNGRGRPENASPAGYTASYIVQQMMDYKNGLRRSSDPRKNNVNLMASYAKEATDEEIRTAAEYFAALPIPQGWITVKEVAMVPKTKIAGNVYFELEGAEAGTEPIGSRVIEVPAHGQERFEMRDGHAGYIAYVPVGAIKKGEALAKQLHCSVCHGANLEGLGPVPTLAGRSPSYMARQLFDFQTGARHGLWSDLMKPVVAKMTNDDLVNITAYMASKTPPPAAGARQGTR